MARKPAEPPGALPIGASGLPVLDALDYEQTATKQTDTNVSAPISTRQRPRPTLTVLVGTDAGKITDCGEVVLIGRASGCQVILPDPGVSRSHARITRRGERFELEDLGSKNHTFVNRKRVTAKDLRFGDEIQIGPNVTLRFASMGEAEERLAKRLYDSSMRDALTDAFNRRYYMERLASELAYSARHKTCVSVAVFDFDLFKKLNDTHGHAAGDMVLRAGAAAVGRVLRSEDVLARIGGEEFAIILRGIDERGVVSCAERVREAVELCETVSDGTPIRTTISVGVATDVELGTQRNSETLLRLADRRLYAAKAAGRNCVRGR